MKIARNVKPRPTKSKTETVRKVTDVETRQNEVRMARNETTQLKKKTATSRKMTGREVRKSHVKIARNKLPLQLPYSKTTVTERKVTDGRSTVTEGGNEPSQPKKRRRRSDKKVTCRQSAAAMGRNEVSQPKKRKRIDKKVTGRQSTVAIDGNEMWQPKKRKVMTDKKVTGRQSAVAMDGNEMWQPKRRRMNYRKCGYCAFHTNDRVAKVEHDNVCHPHRCPFCQHRFSSQVR